VLEPIQGLDRVLEPIQEMKLERMPEQKLKLEPEMEPLPLEMEMEPLPQEMEQTLQVLAPKTTEMGQEQISMVVVLWVTAKMEKALPVLIRELQLELEHKPVHYNWCYQSMSDKLLHRSQLELSPSCFVSWSRSFHTLLHCMPHIDPNRIQHNLLGKDQRCMDCYRLTMDKLRPRSPSVLSLFLFVSWSRSFHTLLHCIPHIGPNPIRHNQRGMVGRYSLCCLSTKGRLSHHIAAAL
jgi:hypothetical protein